MTQKQTFSCNYVKGRTAVSMQWLLIFAEKVPQGLSTGEVVQQIVGTTSYLTLRECCDQIVFLHLVYDCPASLAVPETQDDLCRYVDTLPESVCGVPQFFISHRWSVCLSGNASMWSCTCTAHGAGSSTSALAACLVSALSVVHQCPMQSVMRHGVCASVDACIICNLPHGKCSSSQTVALTLSQPTAWPPLTCLVKCMHPCKPGACRTPWPCMHTAMQGQLFPSPGQCIEEALGEPRWRQCAGRCACVVRASYWAGCTCIDMNTTQFTSNGMQQGTHMILANLCSMCLACRMIPTYLEWSSVWPTLKTMHNAPRCARV